MRLRTQGGNAKAAKAAKKIPARIDRRNSYVARFMRTIGRGTLCALCVYMAACSNTSLFRQYEYEEDVYLALDGTATIYVNSSIAALNALRGTSFDANPAARVDTDAVRTYYSTADTHVIRIRQFRRSNRRFVSVRLDIDDVRRLGGAPPFAWSTYRFDQQESQYAYLQTIGASAGRDPGSAGWNGRELVAFRLHVPSRIRYHNTHGVESRGNILTWEQPLADRLRGEPLSIEARMDTQSILYTTLWLFAITFVAVAVAFAVVIWWVMRRGVEPPMAAAR